MTKMSSKGQVVIPSEIRTGICEGEKLIVIRNHDQIIIKQASKLDANFREELAFAEKTESAWKRIKEEKGVEFDDFIDEMKQW